MQSFAKLKLSRNGKITLSFTDIRNISCTSREVLTSKICLLMLFAKTKIIATVSEFTVHAITFLF